MPLGGVPSGLSSLSLSSASRASLLLRARLKQEGLRILQLTARTFEIHHQFARDFQRQIAAEIFFDKREAKINARGNSGRRTGHNR